MNVKKVVKKVVKKASSEISHAKAGYVEDSDEEIYVFSDNEFSKFNKSITKKAENTYNVFKDLNKTLHKRMLKHTINFGIQDCILEILRNTKAFIAGSFALSVYLDEEFLEQDLDIYLRVPFTKDNFKERDNKYYSSCYTIENLAKQHIHNLLTNCGYIIAYKEDRELELTVKKSASEVLHETTFDYDGDYAGHNYFSDEEGRVECIYIKSGLSHYIKNIVTYENKTRKKRIQIITLYNCKIHEYLDLFDLNICRIVIEYIEFHCNNIYYYDYDYYEKPYENTKGGFIYYHDKNNYLNKYELSLISSKKMYIYNPMHPPNLPPRLIKYIDRGFTWFDKKTGEPIDYVYVEHEICYTFGSAYRQFIDNIKTVVKKLGYTKTMDYNTFIKSKYRLNINKIIQQELVCKVFNPDRMLRMCKMYNMTFDELSNIY